jgi:ABC-type polysaccharide transport system permease subunit
MKRITESDIRRIVKRVINENDVNPKLLNMFKKTITDVLSQFDWFDSLDIIMKTWKSNKYGWSVPVVSLNIKTISSSDYENVSSDLGDIENEIEFYFKMFFPWGEDGLPDVIWEVNYK